MGHGKFRFRRVGDSNATTSKGGNVNTSKGDKTPKASTSNVLLKVARSNNLYELLSKVFDTAFDETSKNDVEGKVRECPKWSTMMPVMKRMKSNMFITKHLHFWRHHPKVLS